MLFEPGALIKAARPTVKWHSLNNLMPMGLEASVRKNIKKVTSLKSDLSQRFY
jgi:hypothetical protein